MLLLDWGAVSVLLLAQLLLHWGAVPVLALLAARQGSLPLSSPARLR